MLRGWEELVGREPSGCESIYSGSPKKTLTRADDLDAADGALSNRAIGASSGCFTEDRHGIVSDYEKALEAEPNAETLVLSTDAEGHQVISGTVPQLIRYLVTNVDSAFMEDFLLSYRVFLKTDVFAAILANRLWRGFSSANEQPIKVRTFVILRHWLRNFHDVDCVDGNVTKILLETIERIWRSAASLSLADKQMLIKLRFLAQGNLQADQLDAETGDAEPKKSSPGVSNVSSSSWKTKLQNKFRELFVKKAFGGQSSAAGGAINGTLQMKYTNLLLRESSSKLAQHFCLIECELMQALSWKCFLYYPANSTSCRAIIHSVTHFNSMCRWLITEVINSASNQEQTLLISKLLRIAMRCLGYLNFNSLMQIMLCLQNPTIQALQLAWIRLSEYERAVFAELVEFVSPLRNFRNIRRAMELQKHKDAPCIPFSGLFFSDLVSNSKIPEVSLDNCIPWYKFRQSARMIKQYRALQVPERGYLFNLNAELYAEILRVVAAFACRDCEGEPINKD